VETRTGGRVLAFTPPIALEIVICALVDAGALPVFTLDQVGRPRQPGERPKSTQSGHSFGSTGRALLPAPGGDDFVGDNNGISGGSRATVSIPASRAV